MPVQISAKVGDTVTLNAQLLDDTGNPVDVSDYTITASAADGLGNALGAAAVSLTNPTNGQFSVSWNATQGWPLGNVRADVLYVYGSQRVHTDTFSIAMSAGITS